MRLKSAPNIKVSVAKAPGIPFNPQQVLFEDNHLIIINKKSSQIVQGDKTGDLSLIDWLKGYIKEKYDKPGDVFLGSVHRIDRPVSGIVVFAKTSKALSRLNEMFRKKEVQKTYWAIVQNRPPQEEEVRVDFLIKNEKLNKSFVTDEKTSGALKSELIYRILDKSERYFLLEILPLTGRHHQIRTQLAHMGSPIKGDVKYGFKRPNSDASIHLHARKIEFLHPVKKEKLSIVAPLPDDVLYKLFKHLT